jgi:hypothetical protein
MLIACRFHRPNAPVVLPNPDGTTTTYFFRPIAPNSPESEHVAEVEPAHHVERLLAIPEGYYIAEANAALASAAAAAAGSTPKPVQPAPIETAAAIAPVAPATAAAAVPPVEATVAPPAAPTDQAGDTTPPPDSPARKVLEDAAHELLARSPAAFKAAVQTVAPDVLKVALEIEGLKGSEERATYTKALRAALSK